MINPDPWPSCGMTSSQKFIPRVVVAIFTTAGRTFLKTSMLIFSSGDTIKGLVSECSLGLLKSSAKDIIIEFEKSKVTDVKMFGSPISEYHPENLVEGNEKIFTLPTFILYSNKPDKKKFNSFILKNNLK